MLAFLQRLFRREKVYEPGSLVEELWIAQLSGEKGGRFQEGDNADYEAKYLGRESQETGLSLALKRRELFAWTEAPLYRQGDFVLEGSFEIAAGSPHSACGFLFRYQDEGNFYAALVSSRGYFRLDLVFNGSPRPLVAWTECPLPAREACAPGSSFRLRVIARGGHFTLIINDLWAAEAADDGFRQGHFAFAAQAYDEEGPTRVLLHSCRLESRPIEVETWYFRWNYYLVPDSAARRVLAETLFAMGEHLGAAIQLRKIEVRRSLDAEELFLKAEVALRLGLQDEAETALNACLKLQPGRRDAAEEKANLLYLRGRNLELRELLEKLLPEQPDNARLHGLAGHARFGLGDYEGAAAAYRRAADLDTEQALFRMNEARAWDQAGKKTEAAAAYLAAARLFALQGGDDDLALAFHRLAALKPRSLAVKEIKAKALFRQGKKAEATKLLSELVAKGSEDSAVHYLLGILLAEKGEGEEALQHFAAAVKMESDYPLFAFRYAERLFLLGRDARTAIQTALRLAPTDGWTLNLAGQEALARGDEAEARLRLEAARAALPNEAAPAANLAELEARGGRVEAALAAVAPFPEDAACRNQCGNVLAAAGRLGEAIREYEKACRIDPRSAAFRTNLAAAYLATERLSDAEDSIRRALDLGGGSGTLLLAGNLASEYGDRPRAEAAYRLGLEASPSDPSLLFALGRCYLGGRNVQKASECARRLAQLEPERARRLTVEIEKVTTEGLSCASCGHAWRVPRELPVQSASSIRGMPPDDAPAGACPSCDKVFCIACRKDSLEEKRFTCPDCGEILKLSDDRLRYLVRESLRLAIMRP